MDVSAQNSSIVCSVIQSASDELLLNASSTSVDAERNLTIEHSLSCEANFINIVTSLRVQLQLILYLNTSSLTL